MDYWRKKKKPEPDIAFKRGAKLLEDLIECCDGKSNPIKFFSANEICKATDNFSDSNHITFYFEHNWYSGKNEKHDMILIKNNLYWLEDCQLQHFCRDIAVSSMVSGHKNFLKLVGCCLEFECPVIIYHGVKKHSYVKIKEQSWKRRMKIAEDIATALAYLHTAFARPFVYRCMFLENILLDEDGVVKLSDFSYCVSIPEGEISVKVDDRLEGQYSFIDGNYMMSGVVSVKTDVFAIGIVMQKLLTGQEIIWELYDSEDIVGKRNMNDQRRHIQNWLSKLEEDRRTEEIADPKMLEKMSEISEQELCQMKAFLKLSMRCVGRGEEVPTMVEVAKELKKIQRSLNNNSSSPSSESQFDSAQDISSSVLPSNQTLNTKALLTSIASQAISSSDTAESSNPQRDEARRLDTTRRCSYQCTCNASSTRHRAVGKQCRRVQS